MSLAKLDLTASDYEVAWAPQPGKQTAFVLCPIEDIFYGGARGGAKTDGIIGKWLVHADMYKARAMGLIIRETMPQLSEIIERTREIFPKLGAKYHVNDKMWRHPSGWKLRLGYLQDESDYNNYHGHQYTFIGVDEATNFTNLKGIDKLRSLLRSASGVPPQLVMSGNPGGPSHNLIKFRYISQSPPMVPFWACARCDLKAEVDIDRESRKVKIRRQCTHNTSAVVNRVYIPSTLDDNPLLRDNDPGYLSRLEAACGGDQTLLEAWKKGNWDVIAGGMFDDLWYPSGVELEVEFDIPSNWPIYRGLDWGSSKPFCTLWMTVANGEEVMINGKPVVFPPGTLIVIAEDYGWTGKPDDGLNLPPEAICARIQGVEEEYMRGRFVHPGPADLPSYRDSAGETVEMKMSSQGITWLKPDKSKGSRVNGWQAIRSRLANNLKDEGKPGLFVFKYRCPNLCRTMTSLPRDPKNRDDVNTKSEDHAPDTLRMLVMRESIEVSTHEIGGT